MFPLTLTINDPTELAKVLAALGFQSMPQQADLPLESAPAKKSKATPAEKAAPAPSQPTAEVAVADAPAKTVAESAQPAASAVNAAPASTAAIDYPTLQKAVFTLAGKSRESAAAVAASFGVKTFKELDSSKWADALAAVNAALAA